MIDISVIIVSFNTRDILRDCIASVLHDLEEVDLEVFVVDNASSDASPEMVASDFPAVHLICNTDNRGFAAANNQAIENSTGRYVLLLNSDTIVLGDVLARSASYMDEHPDVGVMGCRVLNEDRSVQYTCAMQPSILTSLLKLTGLHTRGGWFGQEHYRGWNRDSERDVGVVTGCYMLVRRTAMDQVGLLDERFFFNYEETDWCLRFQKAGWRTVLAPVGEIIHLGGASSGRGNPSREHHLIRGKVQYFTKHRGRLAGSAIWLLSFLFWLSRWIFAFTSVFSASNSAKERRTFINRVIAGFPGLPRCLRGIDSGLPR